jgi:hypothetical protein
MERPIQQWEYLAIMRDLQNAYWTTEMNEELARLGRQGWELVTAYPVDLEIRPEGVGGQRSIERRERWVFKRPMIRGKQAESSSAGTRTA